VCVGGLTDHLWASVVGATLIVAQDTEHCQTAGCPGNPATAANLGDTDGTDEATTRPLLLLLLLVASLLLLQPLLVLLLAAVACLPSLPPCQLASRL
jgi:hypothetical protein